MRERTKRITRRNFLLTVSASTAVTAAAIVVKSALKVRPTLDGHGKRATRGYQSSEHVNNYYRTTKV